MGLNYYLLDPTGNITAQVETPIPVSQQSKIAQHVMEQEPTCEQVSFTMPTLPNCNTSIRMAGGEFCGNASMCAATMQYIRQGMKGQQSLSVSVSGTVVKVTVADEEPNYPCTVEMPQAKGIEMVRLDDILLPVVHFDGISHGILSREMDKSQAETIVCRLCEMTHAEAAGLMLFDEETMHLNPLVYVPNAHTMCWEGACGSGSCAIGTYLSSREKKPISLSLCQPGGILGVEAEPDGAVRLRGRVRVLYQKTIA